MSAHDTGGRRARENAPTLPRAGAASSDALGTNARIAGRYEILGVLGIGGMGCVYRARDTQLDEVVALKMLRHGGTPASDASVRLRREVKLARRVTHRNIARTFDIGEHAGEPFLTMELIEGEPLSRIIATTGAQHPEEVVRIGVAMVAGIAAAHAAGVVHRDLKPDNVLVERSEGRIVITDFGIAHARVDGASAAGLAGTPEYMAPEQVEGAPVDGRADLYALGAVLFELATGTCAWYVEGASPLAIATARLLAPAPDPRARRPGLPDALAEVILRCMARRPGDRYASADDVARALREAAMAPAASWSPGSPQKRGAAVHKTIAVLPLRGSSDDSYVADGLTDDLIDVLSMNSGLRVRPRAVTARFVKSELDPRAIGEQLGVEIVVSGSLRRAGRALVLSARLFTVNDGFQVWARRFEAPDDGTLAMIDAAARSIAEVLTVDLEGPARAPTIDAATTDLYLRARFELHRGWSTSGKRAAELFAAAVARQPDDPNILAGYARALGRVIFWAEGDDGTEELAARIAARAVRAAPSNGNAWAATAEVRWHGRDSVGAMRALKTALARAPQHALVHDLTGRLLLEVGAIEDARHHLQTAISYDPTSTAARVDLARMYAYLDDWDACDDLLARPFEGELTPVYREASRERFAFWRGLPPPPDCARSYRSVYETVIAGRPLTLEQRDELARAALAGGGRRRPYRFQRNAEVLAAAGEHEHALDAVENAIAANLIDVLWMERCALLAPLRSATRWPALLAEVAARARAVVECFRQPGSEA